MSSTRQLKGMYLTGAIIAICAIIATVQAASAAPTISVEPSYIEVSQGDTFTVNITLNSTAEIYGVQYTLYFDNVLLRTLNQNQGSFLSGNIIANDIDNPNGRIDYGEYRTGGGGMTGEGTLATIEFEVRCSGVGELRLGNVKLSDPVSGPISTEVNNATVEVAQSQPSTPFVISGYVSYKDGSECNNPVVNITNLNTSMEWAAETNESANHYQLVLASCTDIIASETLQFNAMSPDGSQWNVTDHTITPAEVGAGSFEYNITLEFHPGDVNGDGRITSADAVIALQMAVCGEYDSMADVNYDNSVTSLDALMILQVAAENITFER